MLKRSDPQLTNIARATDHEEPTAKWVDALLADQKECWRREEQVLVEAYLQEHSWLRSDREAILDLIFQELLLRESRGENPRIEDYVRRFPHLAEVLIMQFEVDRALREELDAPGGDEFTERLSLGSGSEQSHSPSTEPGSRQPSTVPLIPGYESLRELGRGGMGVVYWAWQCSLHRPVALKMILAGAYAGAKDLARFQTEAEAIARLNHPNIVQVYEIGWQQSRPYMALEFVDGESLAQRLSGKPVPQREAARLVETLARAVHYAHERGILHRDLTPANVLMTAAGVPKIADFGLAKLSVEGGPATTQTGEIFGTPSYMAPEQIESKTGEIGPGTDIYSLGVILYQLIAGRVPFTAASALEVLLLVRSTEPLPPRRLQPSLSLDLATIAMKCLEKNPGTRYASALALAEDLSRFLAGEPIRARPIRRAERIVRLCRRNPVVASLMCVVLTLLVAFTAGILVKNTQLASALADSEGAKEQARASLTELGEEQQATQRELQRAQTAEDNGNRELFGALVAEARANRLSRRIGQRFRSLETLQRAVVIAKSLRLPPEKWLELRNEAIAALALLDMRIDREWTEPYAKEVDFDPALERYARVDAKGDIAISRVADQAKLWELRGLGPRYHRVEFSPDGRYLSLVNDHIEQFAIWKLDGVEPEQFLLNAPSPNCHRQVSGVCFSPDSSRFACQDPDGTIAFFDLNSRKKEHSLPFMETAHNLAFDPQGELLGISKVRSAEVLDIKTGKQLWQQLELRGGWPFLKWYPDGKNLAVADDQAIYFWDIPKKKLIGTMESRPGTAFAFNRSGTLMLSNSWSGTLQLWDPLTHRKLFSTFAEPVSYRFSSDGQSFAADSLGGKVRTWKIAPGTEYRTLTGNPVRGKSAFESCAVNPDGNLLAGSREGGVVIWDLRSGKELAFLDASPGRNFVLWQTPGDRSWQSLFNSIRSGEKGTDEVLLVSGSQGLFRWQIRKDPATGSLSKKTLLKLPIRGAIYECAQSKDGNVVASAQFSETLVWRADQPNTPRHLQHQKHEDIRYVAVSPNGSLVVTGCHSEPGGARVWDSRTRSTVSVLPVDAFCHLVFSPDGRSLLTSSGNTSPHYGVVRRWETETWTEVPFATPVAGVRPAFSPDGKYLVVETGVGIARLLDAATGREYARFEDPLQDRTEHFTFTPDSSKLICASQEGFCVHVWDVEAIRKNLAVMDLDWKEQ